MGSHGEIKKNRRVNPFIAWVVLGGCAFGAMINSYETQEEKVYGFKTTLGLTQGEIIAAMEWPSSMTFPMKARRLRLIARVRS